MLTIRRAHSADAEKIQDLLCQLGYSVDVDQMEKRLRSVESGSTDVALVAEEDGHVIAVTSLHVFELFHQPGLIGRITSFVVDVAARGKGVGSTLLAAADEFFRSVGCIRAEVTSGDHRPSAHAFYESQGYLADERRFLKRYM